MIRFGDYLVNEDDIIGIPHADGIASILLRNGEILTFEGEDAEMVLTYFFGDSRGEDTESPTSLFTI